MNRQWLNSLSNSEYAALIVRVSQTSLSLADIMAADAVHDEWTTDADDEYRRWLQERDDEIAETRETRRRETGRTPRWT